MNASDPDRRDKLLIAVGNAARGDDGLGWAFADAVTERGYFDGRAYQSRPASRFCRRLAKRRHTFSVGALPRRAAALLYLPPPGTSRCSPFVRIAF